MCETDEEESTPSRLRTRPRLAKIKSVQNMKLMTQSLLPKTPTHSTTNRKENKCQETSDDISSVKGDNEDEIAELMLACTTIKKNTASRKKTKQARELENIKRFLEAEKTVRESDKTAKFAASFIQKLFDTLKLRDPETLKLVLKLYFDTNEKLASSNQDNDTCSSIDSNGQIDIFKKTIQRNNTENENKDKLVIDLYFRVCEVLRDYPDLCSDFLLFLTLHQAAAIDKFPEHLMMTKMSDFLNIAQVYFAKQPSRLTKLNQAITEIASNPFITIETVQSTMGTVLKGHPLIMDMFLQVLPTGKPPDCLFDPEMFENLTCPVGPHDKHKIYDTHAPELYENIELPLPQEDPYGGDNCKCNCHSTDEKESKLKTVNEHCAACGIRYLNGRIYLQTPEGLRPAKITFPGSDDEKLENITRVSLRTIDKSVSAAPNKRRRRSSKNDLASEDANSKQGSVKTPTKENEEADKANFCKPKKGSKSPSKASSDSSKKIQTKAQSSVGRSKREKRSDKKDHKNVQDFDSVKNQDHSMDVDIFNGNIFREENVGHIDLSDSHEEEILTSPEKMNISATSAYKNNIPSDSEDVGNLEIEKSLKNKAWTKQEDKVLLENVRREFSEKTFSIVSSLLKNRSIAQVKERCEYLLSLIDKMSDLK